MQSHVWSHLIVHHSLCQSRSHHFLKGLLLALSLPGQFCTTMTKSRNVILQRNTELAKSHDTKARGAWLHRQEDVHATRQIPSCVQSDLVPSGNASFGFLLVPSESLHIDHNFPRERDHKTSDMPQRRVPLFLLVAQDTIHSLCSTSVCGCACGLCWCRHHSRSPGSGISAQGSAWTCGTTKLNRDQARKRIACWPWWWQRIYMQQISLVYGQIKNKKIEALEMLQEICSNAVMTTFRRHPSS